MTLRNALTFLGNHGAKAMAVMLLLPLAAVVSGCLVPQDDQVFPALPPRKNSIPRIVRASPDQRETTVKVGPVSTTCPKVEFSASVSDDLGDTISAKWFVDATQDFKPTLLSPEYVSGQVVVSAPVGTSSTYGVATVTSTASLANKLTQLIDGKKHRVDVWVTDGRFLPDSIDVTLSRTQIAPDGTVSSDCSITDGGVSLPYCDVAYKDNYVWLVEVQTCP